MEQQDRLAREQFVFAYLFVIANKLQVIGDRLLDGFTMKQWLLTAAVAHCGAIPPKLSEVAELMGSSHQNVKQIALKLEEKGFLRLARDPRDSRALRLILTEKSNLYWENRQTEDERFLRELFAGFSPAEINALSDGIDKLHQKVQELLIRGDKKDEV